MYFANIREGWEEELRGALTNHIESTAQLICS
jgi:hypothetical protein